MAFPARTSILSLLVALSLSCCGEGSRDESSDSPMDGPALSPGVGDDSLLPIDPPTPNPTGSGGATSPSSQTGGTESTGTPTGGSSSGGGGGLVIDGQLPSLNLSDAERMFQDDESIAVFTSTERAFRIAEMLRIRAIDERTIEVANFAPADITDAILTLSIEGGPSGVHFLKLSIPAHGIARVEYPFIDPTALGAEYPTTTGTPITLDDYLVTGIDPNQISFSFNGEAGLARQLAAFRDIDWELQFNDFDASNNSGDYWYDDPTPRHARLWTGLFINMAHLFLDARYQPEFIAEALYDDSVVMMSIEEKEALYQRILDLRALKIGVVEGVSGLGNTSGMGLADYVLGYYLYIGVEKNAIHELGHVLGYGHSSNMTYSTQLAPFSETAGEGFTTLSKRISDDLWQNGQFPITQGNYYKPEDHQQACSSDGDCPRYMRCTGTEFSTATYCE